MTAVIETTTQPRRPVEMIAAKQQMLGAETHQAQLRAASRARVMAVESLIRSHPGEYARALRIATGMFGVEPRILARITEDEMRAARILLLREELARLCPDEDDGADE